MLVAYEGSANPLRAWSIAADRTTEILIGIACGTLASVIILPRYAGDALREAQANTVAGLARYVAARPAPVDASQCLRAASQADGGGSGLFDALCSSTMFETPEMRIDEEMLRRTVREFLTVLSIARGLYARLDEFDNDDARRVRERLRPGAGDDRGMDRAYRRRSGRLERYTPPAPRASDRAGCAEERHGRARRHGRNGAVRYTCRVALDREPRRRCSSRLGMTVVIGAASHRNRNASPRNRRRERRDPEGRREALLLAIRAALAMLLLSGFWMATGWSQGFTAVSGGAIMLFFA